MVRKIEFEEFSRKDKNLPTLKQEKWLGIYKKLWSVFHSMKVPGFRSNFWIVLGLLFSLILLFVFYVSHQLNQVKQPLIAFLKKQIQGDIEIKEARASLFPPGIQLKEVRLFSPGDSQPAVYIQEAELNFKIFPLLQKEIDTKIYIEKPQLRLVLDTDGKNNFEKIFSPLLSNEAVPSSKLSEKIWWERISVSKLVIRDAQFSSSDARNAAPIEMQNLNVEANDLRFDSSREPARIKIEFDLPRVSRKKVELSAKLKNLEKQQALLLQDGKVEWGALRMDLGGSVLLPKADRAGVELNLNFNMQELDLKKFSKSFREPLDLNGDLVGKGSLQGSAFRPVLSMSLSSRSLQIQGKQIDRLQMELSRKDKAIEITKADMAAFGGGISATGTLLPEKTVSGNFQVDLKSLSLASLTGKPHPARLSGKLDVNGSDVSDARSFSGSGDVSLGPLPLPGVDLKSMLKLGEVMDAALLEKALNLGFLSSSANVIGTQIDTVLANISFSGDDIIFNSFKLSNSHFSALGSGSLKGEKTLRAAGMATLSPAVSALLFPDSGFRSVLTSSKGSLSLPFHVAGTVDDPQFSIDASYLKNLIAKAAAASLKKIILGDAKPQDLLNSVLQETPLGKNLPPASPKKNSKPKTFEQFLWGK